MKDFQYYAPQSLEEACTLLDQCKGEGKPLAGGTDLIVQMKNGRTRPSVIIDVKKVPEMNKLEWTEDRGLFIGAAVPLSRIVAFPPVSSRYGLLHKACSLIGSFQLRSRATMGGNICNAAPSADSAPPLLCLQAQAIVARPEATRTLPLTDFFAGPGKTTLNPNELVVGFEIPSPPASSSGCYLRHIPRQDMDIAVVGVASFLVFEAQGNRCREARIALGAVAPTPVRVPDAEALLEGKILTEKLIEEAANLTSEAARPISDMRGSASYRREIIRVLTSRALRAVMDAGNVQKGV